MCSGSGDILRYGNKIYSISLKKLGNKKGNKNTRNILGMLFYTTLANRDRSTRD